MPAPNYNLFDLINILRKWRKPIVYVCLAAILISSVIAMLLPVYYKSTAVFYPYNLKALDPKNIASDITQDIFGTGQDADRFLSISKSSMLENILISKFDLYKRYEVDTTKKYARTSLLEDLRSNFSVVKNERSALEVTVYDKDPAVAASMANEAMRLMDEINKGPMFEKNKKILALQKAQVEQRYIQVDSILQSVKKIRKEETPQSRSPKQYFDDLKNIDIRLTNDVLEMTRMKEWYEIAMSLYNNNLSSIMIVEPATIPEKKAKPIRWLIVAASTLGAFILMCMIAIFMEMYKNEGGKTYEDRT